MGGSSNGGVGSVSYNREKITDALRQAVETGVDQNFKGEVSSKLAELLANYNDRDVNLTRGRLDEVKQALAEHFDGSFDICFGGSVAKHTYVDGLSDVDCLVQINDSDLEGLGPQKARERVAGILSKALKAGAEVSEGNLAVTLTYSDGTEIQILPAIKTANGYKISSASGSRWSEIDPTGFQTTLTKYNEECNGKLVPTIKLAKAIIGQLPKEQKLSGYHIESLAVDAFRNYTGICSTVEMLSHFFEHSKTRVMHPMTDSTGQSVHVDSYLNQSNSYERVNASHLLGGISKRIRAATSINSMKQWKELFGVSDE